MRFSRSTPGLKLKAFAYGVFRGLDTSRDITAMDRKDSMVMAAMVNCFADRVGQIVREPAAEFLAGEFPVRLINYLDPGRFVFAEQLAGMVRLASSQQHAQDNAFPVNTPLSAAVFSNRVWIVGENAIPWNYDGMLFRQPTGAAIRRDPPAMVTVVNRRLAVAGMARYRQAVWLSRVDQGEVMPPDEDVNEENVLRAGDIDISNMTNSGEVVTGIFAFEFNRLAVFTQNTVLMYVIDPNIEAWTISAQMGANVGCISHRSIVQAGRDLLFCSRHGVHSISRSMYNSAGVNANTYSKNIDVLYRSLLSKVPRLTDISAVWDDDTSRYHIFFPENELSSYCLTMALPDGENEEPRWSLTTHLNPLCGTANGGEVLYGTPGGVYRAFELGQAVVNRAPPVAMAWSTPILWCGSTTDIKDGYSYLLQVSGEGVVEIEIFDEEGTLLQTDVIEVEGNSANLLSVESFAIQYERRMELRFRGLRFTMGCVGTSFVRVTALAIYVRG